MMPFAVRRLATLGVLVGAAFAAWADDLELRDGWVAAAPETARTQAAYVRFVNNGDKDVVITGVSAKGYGSAMLHSTMQHNGMTMMHMLATLTVPAHGSVALEPGKQHIMLMDPQAIAKTGDNVALTFSYRDGTTQMVELPVKNSGAAPRHE